MAQNEEESIRWFQKAAEQGKAGSMYNLAHAYSLGKAPSQQFSTLDFSAQSSTEATSSVGTTCISNVSWQYEMPHPPFG